MRIRFINGVAGARFAYEPGDEPDLAPEIAREFVKQGVAVQLDYPAVEDAAAGKDDAIETAVAAAPETTARRPRRRRGLGALFPQ